MKLCISPKDEVETVLNSESQSLDAPGCRGNHEANRCDNAADGIFFPALEQNMMGAV